MAVTFGQGAWPQNLDHAGVPTHPAQPREPSHRIVQFRGARSRQGFEFALRRAGETVLLDTRHMLAIDDGNAYLAAGLWLPDYMAREAVARGELAGLFDGWEIAPLPLYVAYPANPHVGRKLRVFIDWVVEFMEEKQ